jgi:tetratricopeptide (TPR) repeat protein/CHAT domain-containing protein
VRTSAITLCRLLLVSFLAIVLGCTDTSERVEQFPTTERVRGHSAARAEGAVQAQALDAERQISLARRHARAARFDSAAIHYETALRLQEARLGPTHPDLAQMQRVVGRSLIEAGDFERAETVLSAALQALQTVHGESHPDVAGALEDLGMVYLETGALDRAADHLERSLGVRKRTRKRGHPDLASSYMALGRLSHERGHYDQALGYFEKASGIYRNADEPPAADLAEVQRQTGRTHWTVGDYQKAIDVFVEALETLRARYGDEHPDAARVLENLGTAHKDAGDYRNALDYLHRAVRIGEGTIGPDHPEMTTSYNNLGIVYDLRGDYDEAIAWYRRAVRVAENAVVPDLREVSRGRHNIGVAAFNKGDYGRASDYLQMAFAAKQAMLEPGDPSLGVSHVSLGVVYSEMGDRDRALNHYRSALAIFQNRFGTSHPYVAVVLHNIGTVLDELGQFDDALTHYERSLAIEIETFGEQHRSVAETYHNVANTYQKKNDPERALAYHRRALRVAVGTLGTVHPVVAKIHLGIGAVHRDRNAFDDALQSFENALHANGSDVAAGPAGEHSGRDRPLSNLYLLETLSAKADVLTRRSLTRGDPVPDLTRAVATYDLAAEHIERTRRGYQREDSKLFLAQEAAGVYHRAVRASLRLFRATGDSTALETAFRFGERSKAGVLLDALIEAEARQFAGIPDSLQARERALRRDLAFYERMLTQQAGAGEPADSARVGLWRAEAFSVREQLQTLRRSLERDHPAYHAMKYGAEVASVQDLQRNLLDADTALLSYSLGEDSLVVFSLTPDRLDARTLAHDPDLAAHVQAFRDAVIQQDYDAYVRIGRWLYGQLVAPVRAGVSARQWIIVPDGVLTTLPFEALLTDDPQSAIRDYRDLSYLVREHTISYGYAATLLLHTRQRGHGPVDRDFVAFAPVFSDGLPSHAAVPTGLQDVGADDPLSVSHVGAGFLPASEEEVIEIQRRFHQRYGVFERLFGRRSVLYLHDAARETRLRAAEISRYRYVHLATHGFISESTPSLSRLVLAAGDTTAQDDGLLHLGEVYGLSLNAELVVLSACQTGLGHLARGEGMIGLTRGFLYAGAENVVVSLWQAPDAPTRDLMVIFYDRLLQERPRAEALREAKMRMIRSDPVLAAPYHWAPFVLIGQ